MSSPLKLDGTGFVLPSYAINKFVSLGTQKGNRGITHTLFLCKVPIHPIFFVGEQMPLTGYCSYRFVYNNNASLLIGIVFLSLNSKSVASDYALSVGNSATEIPDSFEPSFLLEKCTGIILFKASDSSLLAIPGDVSSSLLIKTT